MHAGAHVPDLVGIHLGRYMDAYAQGRYVQVGVLTFGFMGIPIWFRGFADSTHTKQSKSEAKAKGSVRGHKIRVQNPTDKQTNGFLPAPPPSLPSPLTLLSLFLSLSFPLLILII